MSNEEELQKEIEELKTQLSERDAEIERLNKKIDELEAQKDVRRI